MVTRSGEEEGGRGGGWLKGGAACGGVVINLRGEEKDGVCVRVSGNPRGAVEELRSRGGGRGAARREGDRQPAPFLSNSRLFSASFERRKRG